MYQLLGCQKKKIHIFIRVLLGWHVGEPTFVGADMAKCIILPAAADRPKATQPVCLLYSRALCDFKRVKMLIRYYFELF